MLINIFLSYWQIRFIDNTDPAGIDHQIAQLGDELASTLVIVISKVCVEIILPYVFSPHLGELIFIVLLCLK